MDEVDDELLEGDEESGADDEEVVDAGVVAEEVLRLSVR